MKLIFTQDRLTKNKTRFAETVADGKEDAVGTLYVRQTALDGLKDFDPEKGVTVTITATK